jgi:hypothetical protein
VSRALSHPPVIHLDELQHSLWKMSIAFPFLAPALPRRFIDIAATEGETAMHRQFVAWVRKNQWARSGK